MLTVCMHYMRFITVIDITCTWWYGAISHSDTNYGLSNLYRHPIYFSQLKIWVFVHSLLYTLCTRLYCMLRSMKYHWHGHFHNYINIYHIFIIICICMWTMSRRIKYTCAFLRSHHSYLSIVIHSGPARERTLLEY